MNRYDRGGFHPRQGGLLERCLGTHEELAGAGSPRIRAMRVGLLAGFGVTAAAWIFMGRPADTSTAESLRPSVVPDVYLPVDVNERVQKWIERFQTDQRPAFERHLAREGMYSGLIRAKLRERSMPQDLVYLAMIESGFYAGATSKVAAVGVWQFMGPTAREYGLRVDSWVDERRDPVRATDAALDYLEWLYDRYGSWYLAAAAYNAGPGRVDRALRRHGAGKDVAGRRGDEALYWEIQEHLPPETRAYVPKVLAASVLARQAEANGFRVVPDSPYMFDRVWVPGATDLAEIARALDVPFELMSDLNPHLVQGFTPPGASYGLRVPVGSTDQVVASLGRDWRVD